MLPNPVLWIAAAGTICAAILSASCCPAQAAFNAWTSFWILVLAFARRDK